MDDFSNFSHKTGSYLVLICAINGSGTSTINILGVLPEMAYTAVDNLQEVMNMLIYFTIDKSSLLSIALGPFYTPTD